MAEEIWVTLSEAVDLTGYNLSHIRHLAHDQSKLPEEQREIKMRKRSFGWELWLPDLMAYRNKPGHGPQRKRKPTSEGSL
jgi:hypothetical protein